MPDSPGQGIDVGDAVLTFLGDTTQLDQAFDRVATSAEVKMAKAADSVSQVGDAADDAGAKLGSAGVSAEVAGEKIQGGMAVSRRATMEARGEAMLLGEAFGVHLPRHVSRFVAELPGVGTALSAAFSATAVLFLLDALVKGSEKLADWVSTTFIFTQAMKESDEAAKAQNKTLLELAAQLDKDTDALDKFGKTQSEIKSDKVKELREEIAKNTPVFNAAAKAARDYATTAHTTVSDELLQKTSNLGGFLGTVADAYVRIAVGEQHVFDSITAFFTGSKTPTELAAEAAKAGQTAQAAAIETAKKLADEKLQLSLAEKEAAAQAVSDQESAAKKTIDIAQRIGAAKIREWAALTGYEARFAEDAAQATLKVREQQAEKEYQLKLKTLEKEKAAEQGAASHYKSIGDEQAANKEVELARETGAKIEELQSDHTVKMLDQQRAFNEAFTNAAVSAAKRAYDGQLESIEKFKRAQLDLYASGKAGIGSWEQAQVHATAAAAIAHEDYLKKVIAVYKQQGDVQKAQTAEEELASLKRETLARDTEKLSAAMEKLTSATKEAKDEERKLAEDTISQHFKDQETAIAKLAEMHLITEKQKDDRLKLLEQQQANEALAILDKELKDAQKLRDEAQSKLSSAKANPASTSTELTALQAELQKEVAAVAKAEDAKLQAQEKYNQKSEADDKSHYGRALLVVMAYGNEVLAEQLRQNHATLLLAQSKLAEAKASGANTDALKQEIAERKKNEIELEKEASGNKAVLQAEIQLHETQLLAATAIRNEAQTRDLNTTAIDKQIAALQKLIAAEKQEVTQTKLAQSAWDTFSKDIQKQAKGDGDAASQMGDMMANACKQMEQAFESAMAAAILSEGSFAVAMEKATAQILAQLSAQAAVKALYNLAEGFAALAGGDGSGAADYFIAAAEFGAISAATGFSARAINPSSSSSGSPTQQGPNPGQATFGGGTGGGSTQTGGVTKLASGGVVSRKIMIGDSPSGGDADEAILPLSDASAMSKIVQAILPVLPQNAPGFGFGTPTQRPPLGFDLSQPSSSDRPDIHSGNPADGDFERSEASIPRDMAGMEAMAASFGALLSTPTLRGAAGSRGVTASAATAAAPTGFDSASMEKFADRIGTHMKDSGAVSGGGGDQTHVHVNVKGMISPDNLNKVVKKINRAVANRQTTLNATNSLRVTRRSQ